MNYKTLILSILVSPCALFAHSDLESLKEQYVLKQREVREITGEILEAYNRLQMIWDSYNTALKHSTDDRLEEIKDSISEEEMNTIIIKENQVIYEHIKNALTAQNPFDESIIDTMFYNDSLDIFCADKFFEAASFIEYLFIKNALQKFKKALKELAEINQQIHIVQKDNNYA